MPDFKLTLFNLTTDPPVLAEGIMENYGEDWDASLGDFSATVVGDTVEVIAKDVAKGDMRILREDIYRDFGDEDDTMLVRCSEWLGSGNWFEIDLDSDD